MPKRMLLLGASLSVGAGLLFASSLLGSPQPGATGRQPLGPGSTDGDETVAEYGQSLKIGSSATPRPDEFAGDRLAEWDFVGQLAARANPTLVLASLATNGDLDVQAVVDKENPAGLQVGTYPLAEVGPESGWAREALLATSPSPTRAIVVVPRSSKPYVLAILDDRGRVSAPPAYEEGRLGAAKLLGMEDDSEALLGELLRRVRAGEPVLPEGELDPIESWKELPPAQRALDPEEVPAAVLSDFAAPSGMFFDLPSGHEDRVVADGVVTEDELVVMTLLQPDTGILYATALSAGSHLSTVWIPNGETVAIFTHPATEEEIARVPLGDLRGLADGVTDDRVVTILVKEAPEWDGQRLVGPPVDVEVVVRQAPVENAEFEQPR